MSSGLLVGGDWNKGLKSPTRFYSWTLELSNLIWICPTVEACRMCRFQIIWQVTDVKCLSENGYERQCVVNQAMCHNTTRERLILWYYRALDSKALASIFPLNAARDVSWDPSDLPPMIAQPWSLGDLTLDVIPSNLDGEIIHFQKNGDE